MYSTIPGYMCSNSPKECISHIGYILSYWSYVLKHLNTPVDTRFNIYFLRPGLPTPKSVVASSLKSLSCELLAGFMSKLMSDSNFYKPAF